MAAREAANRINPDNSLTDQAREVEAVAAVSRSSRSSRVARINPDRSLRIDPAAANKPVILTDNTAGFGFPKLAAFLSDWPLKAIDLSLTPDLHDNSPTAASTFYFLVSPFRNPRSEIRNSFLPAPPSPFSAS